MRCENKPLEHAFDYKFSLHTKISANFFDPSVFRRPTVLGRATYWDRTVNSWPLRNSRIPLTTSNKGKGLVEGTTQRSSFTHENIFDNLCRLIKFGRQSEAGRIATLRLSSREPSTCLGISAPESNDLILPKANTVKRWLQRRKNKRVKRDTLLRSPESQRVTGKRFNYFTFHASCLFVWRNN